jgi:hypothetical protein
MTAFAPLTQGMIDLALATHRRIELQEETPHHQRRLTVEEIDGKAFAMECRTRRRKYPVHSSVEPAGQLARIIR